VLGRLGELGIANRRQGQVADRAVSVPALVPGLRQHTLRSRLRVEPGKLREPVDPRQAVARLPPPLRIEEVVCQRAGVGLGEPDFA
jgi:hypothetical protein